MATYWALIDRILSHGEESSYSPSKVKTEWQLGIFSPGHCIVYVSLYLCHALVKHLQLTKKETKIKANENVIMGNK